MTTPAIDPTAIKPGDKVTVELIVTGVGLSMIAVGLDGGKPEGFLLPSSIISHTPAPPKPRPLEVGDKVRAKQSPGEMKSYGTILHIHDGWAWVWWESPRLHYPNSEPVSCLECVP